MSLANLPINALPKTPNELREMLDRLEKNSSPTGGGVAQSVFDALFDEATAANDVALGEIVHMVSAGNIDLALADAVGTSFAIGVITRAALSGATAEFQTHGVVGGFTGLTVNARYFLSADTLGLAVTPPDAVTGEYVVFLGFAISATELLFLPSIVVLL